MKINNNKEEKYIERSKMCIAFGISLIVIILIGYMINAVIPDTLDIEYISKNYVKPISDFVAEKSERMQYIVLTVSFPIIYVCIYKILQKVDIKSKNYKRAYNIFLVFNSVIIVGLLGWILSASRTILILQVIIFSITGVLILVLYKDTKSKKVVKYSLYIATTVIIGIVAYLFINPTFEQTRYVAHHADAYYYPILKITSGLTPYIDFTPLYGCYSYVFALIQTIFNNNSIMFFSIINAILVAIVLANLSITINKNIKNKVLGFITIVAMIFPMIIYGFITNGGPYMQYMPHRVLFCSIILLYISIYLKHRESKKKIILQIIGFVISAFAIFWNIETGLIVLIVWTAFLGYEILFFNSLKNKITYLSILKILIMAILSVFMVYFIIMIISYIRTGTLISVKNIMASQLLFYKHGFYMIKMELGKPWMLLIYTYLIGLAISLRKLYFMNSKNRILFKKYAMIFVLSILGIGVFSYYQGRSHDDVFTAVTYPWIILLGIFTDTLLKRIAASKTKKMQISNIIMVSISTVFLSSLAVLTILSITSNESIHLCLNKKQLSSKTILVDFSEDDISNIDFISQYESLYYARYNLKDTKKIPAEVDLFTYKDYEKVINFLEKTDKNIVMERNLFNLLYKQYGTQYYQLIKNKFTVDEKNTHVILINNER